MSVSKDHFLSSFNHYKGDERFRALAEHAAMLLNELEKEREAHTETVRRHLARMGELSPLAALAQEITEELELRERE